jgi:hypothetical protein
MYPSEVTVVTPIKRRPYCTLSISYEYYFSATFRDLSTGRDHQM